MLFSWYVIAYLFLAGLGSGMYFICACCCVYDSLVLKPESARLAAAVEPGFVMVPAFISVAVLFLLFDLGNPEHLWRLIVNPLGSALAIGAWLLFFLLVISVMLVLSAMGRTRQRGFQAFCMVAGALLAIGVMTYTGLLLRSLVTVAFWQTGWLPALFVASSLSTGAAALVITDALLHGSPVGTSKIPWGISGVLCGLEIIVLSGFMASRQLAGGLALESATLLTAGALSPHFWSLVVLCGLAIPAVLHIAQSRVPLRFARVTSSLGVLIGGFGVRYCIVAAAIVSPVTLTVMQIIP